MEVRQVSNTGCLLFKEKETQTNNNPAKQSTKADRIIVTQTDIEHINIRGSN